MANSNRDVRLTLGVDVEGVDGVEKLAGELDALAVEGKETGGAFEASGIAAGHLQEAIAGLVATTKQHRAAEAAAQAETKATRRTLDEQREALARLRIAYQTAGGNAEKYKSDVLQLRTAILDSRTALRQKQDALDTAAAAARIAAAQEKALSEQIVRASAQLNQSTDAYRKQGAAAAASGKQQVDALTKAGNAASLFKNALGQIAAGNLIADGIGNLVGRVKALGVEFVKTIADAQQMRRALNTIYKDTRVAGEQFEFLRKTAMSSGVAVGDVSKAFVKFSAAAQSSGVPLAETNALFESVTRAAGTLGLSGEQVTGTLEALGQMASKGTVSMEELRQQLGDRLPGALGLVAKGLGLTQAELIKLVENGGLAARDLFPALAKSLKEMHGEVEGLTPAYNQLKNVLTATAENAGDSLWTAVLTKGLQGLTIVAGALGRVFADVSAGIEVIAKASGILAASVVTMTNPMDALRDMLDDVSARQAKFGKSIDDVVFKNNEAAKAQEGHNKKLIEAGTAAAQASLAVASTSKAQQAQAEAARLAADNTLDLSSKIVRLKATIDALLASQDKEIEAAGKSAAAAKIHGDSLVKLIELQGQQFLTLEAQAEAADRNLSAMDRLAAAQRAETELLTIKRDEIIKNTAARGADVENMKAEIAEIEKKIIASSAATEKATEAANAVRQEAAARKLAIQTYKDNSAAIGEYRNAMEAAEATLVAMIAAQEQGLATDADVANAKGNVAKATHLFNDAIADSIKAIELESRVKQANTNITLTKLQIEQRNYASLAQAARASGDFSLALYYEIEARRKQIEMIKVSSEAKRLEADATLKALEIERAALDQTDPLLKQKQAEIDLRIANAKAKLLEANAGKDAIAALEREIQLLRDGEGVRDRSRQGIDRDTISRHKNAEAIDRQSAALADQQKLTSDGFKANADGSLAGQASTTLPMDQVRAIVEKLRSGSLNAGDLGSAQEAVKQALNSKAYLDDISKRSGAVSYDAQVGADAIVREVQRALARVQGMTNSEKQRDPDAYSDTRTAGNTTHTVNIIRSGRRDSVNVVSPADANTLTGILRELESAAGSAS